MFIMENAMVTTDIDYLRVKQSVAKSKKVGFKSYNFGHQRAKKHLVWKKKKKATFDTWQLQKWFKHENWVEMHAYQESSINKFEIGPPGGQKCKF